jgi:hypothetical protein
MACKFVRKYTTLITFTMLWLSGSIETSSGQADAGDPARTQEAARERIPEPYSISLLMRKEDDRLDRPVNLKFRKATVDELLAELSRQSGISIRAEERDGSGDELVAVFCNETPVSKILNALWATMSYQGGLWQWRRSNSPRGFRYSLSQPRSARDLRRKLSNEVEAKLSGDVEKLLAAVDAEDTEKEATLSQIYGDPKEGFEKAFTFSKERLWHDIRSLSETLTPQQRASVLSGDLQTDVPLGKVSESARNFYLSSYRDAVQRDIAIGSLRSRPEPTSIQFSREQYCGTPCLRIVVPNSTSGYPVVGGIPIVKSFWSRMKSLWMVDGDTAEDRSEDRVMARPVDAAPEVSSKSARIQNGQPIDRALVPETQTQRLTRRYEQVAEGAHVALIARLPQDFSRQGLSEPWGLTLRDYWKRLWNADLMKKWHDGVQIVSNIGWPLEDPPVPSWFVKGLRKNAKPGELLPFTAVVEAADRLTRSQLLRLTVDFPTFRGLALNRWYVALFRRFPALALQSQSVDGLVISPTVLTSLKTLFPAYLIESIAKSNAKTMWLSVNARNHAENSAREVTLVFKGPSGEVLASFSYSDIPQPRDSSRR